MSHQNKKLSVLAALLLGSSVLAVEADAKTAGVRSVQTRSFSKEYVKQKPSRRSAPLKSLQLKAVDTTIYKDFFESHESLSRMLMAKTFEMNHHTSHSMSNTIHFEANAGNGLSGHEIAELKERSERASRMPLKDLTTPNTSPENAAPIHNEHQEKLPEELSPHVSDKENTPSTVVQPVTLESKTNDHNSSTQVAPTRKNTPSTVVQPITLESKTNDRKSSTQVAPTRKNTPSTVVQPITLELKTNDHKSSTQVAPTIVRAPLVSQKGEISSQAQTHLTSIKDSAPEQELIPVKKEIVQGQVIVHQLEITPDVDIEEQNLLIVDVEEKVNPAPKAPPAPPADLLLNRVKRPGHMNLLKALQNKQLKRIEDNKPQGAQGNLQNEPLKELMGRGRKPRNNARENTAQNEVNADPESVGFRFNLRKVNTQDQNRFAKRLNGEVFADENTSEGQNPFGQLGRNRKNGGSVDPQAAIREAAFKRPQLRKVAEEDKNKFNRARQENPQDQSDLVVGVMVGDSATINMDGLIKHARANQKALQDIRYQRPQLRKVNPDDQNKFAKNVAEKKAANAGQTLAANVMGVQRNDGGSAAVKDRASHALKAVNVFADLKSGFDLKSLLRPTNARPKDMDGDVPSQQSASQMGQAPQNNSVDPSQVSSALTPPTNAGSDALIQDPLQSSVNTGSNGAPSQSPEDHTLIQDLLKSTLNVGGSGVPSQVPGDDVSQGLPQASNIPTPPKMAPPKMLMGSRPEPSAPKQNVKKKKNFALVSLSADIGNQDNVNRMAHHNTSADVMDDLISANPLARLKKTNTLASKEAQEMILREQENALNQQAAMRKIELAHQARLERERLEEERRAEEARQVQARVAQQQKLAMENAKNTPGIGGILDLIKLGQRDDGSAAGFGLKKAVKAEEVKQPEPKKLLKQLQDDPSADTGDILKAALAARSGAIHGHGLDSDEEDDDTWDDF